MTRRSSISAAGIALLLTTSLLAVGGFAVKKAALGDDSLREVRLVPEYELTMSKVVI